MRKTEPTFEKVTDGCSCKNIYKQIQFCPLPMDVFDANVFKFKALANTTDLSSKQRLNFCSIYTVIKITLTKSFRKKTYENYIY